MEEPVIVWAARLGNINMVRARLNDHESPNAICQGNRMSALIAAVRNGHADIASLLIASGAELNHKDAAGKTAIRYSEIGSELERILLASGATDRRSLELIEQQETAEREAREREEQIARQEKERLDLIARHEAFVAKSGKTYQGFITSNKVRNPRITHCYSCYEDLDSRADVECKICGWLVCNCGACGCGWSGHKDRT